MPVGPVHHGRCREFPVQAIHFIDLFCLHSILLGIGPTKKVNAIELPEIGLSKIISDQIGSENPRSHSWCTRCIRRPNAHPPYNLHREAEAINGVTPERSRLRSPRQRPQHGRAGRDLVFRSTYPARRRDNAGPTSDWRGGSAPARPHVKAAQVDANDNARPSSSEFNCASAPRLIRPIARRANNSAA